MSKGERIMFFLLGFVLLVVAGGTIKKISIQAKLPLPAEEMHKQTILMERIAVALEGFTKTNSVSFWSDNEDTKFETSSIEMYYVDDNGNRLEPIHCSNCEQNYLPGSEEAHAEWCARIKEGK